MDVTELTISKRKWCIYALANRRPPPCAQIRPVRGRVVDQRVEPDLRVSRNLKIILPDSCVDHHVVMQSQKVALHAKSSANERACSHEYTLTSRIPTPLHPHPALHALAFYRSYFNNSYAPTCQTSGISSHQRFFHPHPIHSHPPLLQPPFNKQHTTTHPI